MPPPQVAAALGTKGALCLSCEGAAAPKERDEAECRACERERRGGAVLALRTAGNGWVTRKGRERKRVAGNVVTDGVCWVELFAL